VIHHRVRFFKLQRVGLVALAAMIVGSGCSSPISVGYAMEVVAMKVSQIFAADDPSFMVPEKLDAEIERIVQSRFESVEMESVTSRILSGEDYENIRGEDIHRYLRELTEFSQQSKSDGNFLWGRIQGSKYEYEAIQHVENYFRDWGLENVAVEQFPVFRPVWSPTTIELTIRGEGKQEDVRLMTAMTAWPAGATSEEGLTAPIEYVGLGSLADLRGRNVEGKIALLYVHTFEGVLMHGGYGPAIRLVEEYGAAGVILWYDAPGNDTYAGVMYDRNGIMKETPWTNIGYNDGVYLRKRIEHSSLDNPPIVNLKIVGRMRSDLTSHNLMAELPGNSERTIMITAHIDGFFNAALDNGTGVAALLALAKHYSAIPQIQRAYNLFFLVTGDHEATGMGGMLSFIGSHKKLLEKIELAIQLEHLASPGVSKEFNTIARSNSEAPRMLMITNKNPWLKDAFMKAANRYGIVMGQGSISEYAGDIKALTVAGTNIPAVGWIEIGHYYHNSSDSPDLISAHALQNITQAYASIIDKIGVDGIEGISVDSQSSSSKFSSSNDGLFMQSLW